MCHNLCPVLKLLFMLGSCSCQFVIKPMFVNETDLVPRVVNGFQAALGDVPYQVCFRKPINPRIRYFMTFCGGVIIGPTKLLSAAHCFAHKKIKSKSQSIILTKKELKQKYAVAGTLLNMEMYDIAERGTGAQWRRINSVIYPSSFDFPKDDIAVVITMFPFEFNEYVAPISYATQYEDYRGQCLVSGYGRKSTKEKITSEILMLAKLEVLPHYWCTQNYRKDMSKFICTVAKVTDVAKGDSGGPLVCSGTRNSRDGSKGILVGIVSGHKHGTGSFFTRVSAFSHYIADPLNNSKANSRNTLSINCAVILINIYFAYVILFFSS